MRKYLTEAMVKSTAPSKAGRIEIFDEHEDEDGIASSLVLRITPNGVRTFVWRGRVRGAPPVVGKDGRQRAADPVIMTIGDATAVKLGDAREKARKLSKLARAGQDPRTAAAEERNLEWSAVVADFIESYAKKRRTWKDRESVFRLYATPLLKGKLLPEITRADVAAVLDKAAAMDKTDARTRRIAAGRRSPYRAEHTLAAVRKLFNWARVRGLIDHTPIVPGMVDKGDFVSRDRFLSFVEIRAVWLAAEKIGQPFGPLVKMLLLTGQRLGETAGARWAGMDFDNERLWSLGADETKNGKPQLVPLTDTAITLLKAQPLIADPKQAADAAAKGLNAPPAVYVFTTTGNTPLSGLSKAKKKLDGAITSDLPPWRFHDLRRTVATHMRDALGVDRDTVRLVLNHTDSSVTGRYTRGELLYARRRALVAWSRLLSLIVEGGKRWERVARVLAPETEADFAATAEFRRAIQADEDAWSAHLKALDAPERKAA